MPHTGYSSVLVKIQIKHLPNTRAKDYHYTDLINRAMFTLEHLKKNLQIYNAFAATLLNIFNDIQLSCYEKQQLHIQN